MQHRIIETSYGEVMIKEEDDFLCSAYIGDDWDEFVGEIPCYINDDEQHIIYELERIL